MLAFCMHLIFYLQIVIFLQQEFSPIKFEHDYEERRMEICLRDPGPDTPDSIISSSSPECPNDVENTLDLDNNQYFTVIDQIKKDKYPGW